MGKRNSKATNLCYAGIGLSAAGFLAFLFMPCIVWKVLVSLRCSLFSMMTGSSLITAELMGDERKLFMCIALTGSVGYILNGIMFYMGLKNQYQHKKIYYKIVILGFILGMLADGLICIIASEAYGKMGSGCILSMLCMIAMLVLAIMLITDKADVGSQYNHYNSSPAAGPEADPLKKLYRDRVRPAAGQVASAINQKLNQGRIRGCTGMYSQYDIPMTSGEELVIGRDASKCHLVLQGVKISRVHCRIVWNAANNLYYVTDYSSNGTYYMQGNRLPSGQRVAIKAGQQIYLGDRNAVFRLG